MRAPSRVSAGRAALLLLATASCRAHPTSEGPGDAHPSEVATLAQPSSVLADASTSGRVDATDGSDHADAAPAGGACPPGSWPVCEDDGTASVCDDRGEMVAVDCLAKAKRCLHGACVAQECKPRRALCVGRDVYRCNAFGSGSTLEKKCGDAVCIEGSSVSCQTACKGTGIILAKYDCDACDWSKVPFCGKHGPDTSCGSTLCQDGILSAGADFGSCERETDGLVVPGSRHATPCAMGVRTWSYEVCKDGRPSHASRVERCGP